MSNKTNDYSVDKITALEGLDPIRVRPGMYTDTASPLHMLQEVIDNSVDEALAGFASRIEVSLLQDGFYEIKDNGRGIPCGIHPKFKIPAVQMVFTVLHSGSKFNKSDGSNPYTISGGLHGVGVCVTNALSDFLQVDVQREGAVHTLEFSNGEVTKPLIVTGKSKATGTCVKFKPNPKYFDSVSIPVAQLEANLISKAVLCPNLEVVLNIEGQEQKVWKYSNGILEYLQSLMSEKDELIAPIAFDSYFEDQESGFAPNEGISVAFGFYENANEGGSSFVNLIPTKQHGTHFSGFKQALFNLTKGYIDAHAMLPKGVKLSADDCTANLGFVLSMKLLDPSFQNQTKDKLISREALKLAEKATDKWLAPYFSKNLEFAKKVSELAVEQAVARSKKANKTERKKSSSVVLLPGKLTDCESSSLDENELFLVEGDSAGGSAKMARNRETQAILPLRGKVLNTWEEDSFKALSNKEIADISTALGVDLHKPGTGDLSKLRYGKICILADADVDGSHIQTLLLALFLRHFPDLVKKGHIYIACPPLYRVDTEAQSKKKPAKKIYVMSEPELEATEDRLKKDGYKSVKVGRFKGLGEMDPIELKETTLDKEARTLIQVSVTDDNKTEELMNMLMSKNRASDRRAWMEEHGNKITADDF